MNAAFWERVTEAFEEAVRVEPFRLPAELDRICGFDPRLREEVESLLQAHAGASDDFLEIPVPGLDAFQDVAEPDLWIGQQIGSYTLTQKLGSGGMGDVYLGRRAEDEFDLQVAVKLMHRGQDSAAVVRRFKNERQILASLDHPNIARLLDGGRTQQGQLYLVMEYVPGLPITRFCDEKELKIRDRLDLIIQTCEGVQHAHRNAIIHRDLKPTNVLVVEVDGRFVPRIIDFGIAKADTLAAAHQTMLTRYGQFIGTPAYMSPEQADPSAPSIDTRTDVYSLGVLLFELLTGRLPFANERREELPLDILLQKKRESEPQVPSAMCAADGVAAAATADARGASPKQLASQLRGDLDWITLKALAPERERRYGTAADLAADLRRYLKDEPVTARPLSSSYQIRKFVRRHRFATALIVTVTILSVVAYSAAYVAVKQKREAQHQAAETLKAQARLLTLAAAQRLKNHDLAGAQGIILEVLTGSAFAQSRTPAAAISVFQEIRAADAQIAVLSGHGGVVYSARYSPDGTRIVTASNDNTARVWDAHTGAELAVLSGHGGLVQSAAYSPDGTHIVTASDDKTARVWDARTGAELTVLSGHGDRIYTAVYSPDGTRIVTASADRTARVWDVRTGAELTVLSGHGDRISSAAYSPDGTRIVTASNDKTARIWDVRTGAELTVLSGHGNRVYDAAYSPDGTRIVIASSDKSARICDARTGTQLAVLSGHGDVVISAAYSPDGTRIVTASIDKTVRIWDARSGVELAVLSGHGAGMYHAAFSPDGTRIVSASGDKTARIWDARTGAQLAVLSGHGDHVYAAAYSPDGTRIVSASADKTARLWDARTGTQLAVLSGHAGSVMSAAFSPDGNRIVSASHDKTARIWDARTGAQLAVLTGHADWVQSTAYSPDGTRIVTASFDKTARIWDARTGAELAILSGHAGWVTSPAYSPDGTHLVTASYDKTARIWDARTGAQLETLSGHAGFVVSTAYSPDGTRIVTASHDKTARIWDPRTGAELVLLSGPADAVLSAAYSPDSTHIVTTSADNTARIWDARTGAQLAVLSGHGDAVESAAYSPDGTRIVTASDDNTARIWDARIPATIAAQILWDTAAQTDPLADADRAELGLLPDARVRRWGTEGSACDQAAAAFYDPDRLARGLTQAAIVAEVANLACSQAPSGNTPRLTYQAARALLAKSDVKGARQQLELAVSSGYRAAQVDLANLLADASAGMLDPARAVALNRKAWQDGVPIAAYSLGHLYESGVTGLQPDFAKAWQWYQKGADAGEPYALALFADRAEKQALAETDPQKTAGLLVQAFSDYAAAAERAHDEDWPDEDWRQWRYRRATLARILAREGMMQQVADAYAEVLSRKQR